MSGVSRNLSCKASDHGIIDFIISRILPTFDKLKLVSFLKHESHTTSLANKYKQRTLKYKINIMRKHGEIPVNSRLEVKFPSIRDVNVDRLTEPEPELVFKSSRNLSYGTI